MHVDKKKQGKEWEEEEEVEKGKQVRSSEISLFLFFSFF